MKKELLNPVVLSNQLARYGVMDFNVTQWRIFLYAISKVQPNDCEFRPEEIRLRDFCNIFNITSYDDVRNACFTLLNSKITVNDNEYWVFKYCECYGNKIFYQLSPDLSPFLLFQFDNMTIFDLGYTAKLSSKHALRFYVFASSYKKLHTYNMSTKNFSTVLKTNLSPGEISRRILTPAINNINTLTNIRVRVEKLKNRFYFYARELYKNEKDELGVDAWRRYAEIDKEESSLSFDKIEEKLFAKEIEEEKKLLSVG